MATIKIVLDSAQDIKNYSIIINKLSSQAYHYLAEKEHEHLKILVGEITELSKHIKNRSAVLLLKIQSDLYDYKNKIIKLEELDKFAKVASCTTLVPNSVKDIIQDPSVFENLMDILVEYIKELRQDKIRLNKLLEETKEKYQKLQSENSQSLKVMFLLRSYLSQKFFVTFLGDVDSEKKSKI